MESNPETAILGLALTSPRALEDIDHLDPDDFRDVRHGELWSVILKLAQQRKPHDLAAVAGTAKIRGLDGAAIADLAFNAPVSGAAGFYADLIEKEATRRRTIEAATRIRQLAEEADPDQIPTVVEAARGEIDAAARIGGNLEGIDSGAYFAQHLDILERPVELVPTPWPDLNHLIGGWRPGALYVIGARPGVGKSVIGLQAATGLQQSGTVLLSTLEMTRDEVQNRLIAQTASVPLKAFEEPLTENYWKRITAHTDTLANYRIHIDDRAGIGPTEIRSTARTLTRRGKLSAVVVDYLQLMTTPRGDKRARHEIVADFSRQLKLLAKELHVPVIALSQLNRESAGRGDGFPRISDLRESGAVEQDADVIMLLHQQDDHPTDLHVAVGKNRHGSRGSFKLTFEGAYVRAVHHEWRPDHAYAS
ncbi:AAA family ATPase [Brachybacterium muris]|uniref:replicative DNA helicase n=1 Tax=Brachybacterium muris TaxID=219301 RepID=UPI00223AE3F2|nr:DnaB-like helicase C-terminal domain-containing protein [Brachybacterium muris]MCT2177436.1 AAA family ATPase [Brachybacterium muris]